MDIALIAMSGIRCCDAELLEMGLTLPGFVERSKTIASLPSLGLLTLAGMTPDNHQVHYVEVDNIADCPDLTGRADLVAISSFTAQMPEAYALADRLRAQGTTVVMGGPHVTALPDEALAHCDAVVTGEGECRWLDLLADAEAGRLQQRYDPPPGGFDLADAPMPAFHLLDMDRYNRLLVQTSRGCPHRCEFCAASVLITDRYKQKPVAKVLAELEAIHAIWPHPFIEFADDNAMVDVDYWMELLAGIGGRKFKWFAETDLSVSEHPDLLDLMHESGCAQLLIGLESPIAAGLDGLETRANWKHNHLADYRDAIDRIQSRGITVNGCFVIGLDGHGPDIFDAVFEFVRDTGLFEVQITIQTPFPGTPLYDRLAGEGRLLTPAAWDRCTLFDLTFAPANMTADELNAGFKSLAAKLYSDEFTHARREAFFAKRRDHRGDTDG
jgi:radical SAM superfamily enzyme YgiQ (UPF0313 family)